MFRIGDRDPASGMYWVIAPDGSIAGLGRKLFGEKTEAGDQVTAEQRTDGTWLLLGRDGGSATLTNKRKDRAVEPIEKEARPQRAKPEYRRLEVFNRDEPEGGDYDQIRLSCTVHNYVRVSATAASAFLPTYFIPAANPPARLEVNLNGLTANCQYPGISGIPAPLIYGGAVPLIWAYGEREPSNSLVWRPTTNSIFDYNTSGPWGGEWYRVTIIIDLKACRSWGIGTTANPIDLQASSSILAGDRAYYPQTTHTEIDLYGNPYQVVDSVGGGRIIWRMDIGRKSQVNYLRIPVIRDPAYCYPGVNGQGLVWHSGTPAKFGAFPQAWALNNSPYYSGLLFLPGEKGRFRVRYPKMLAVDNWQADFDSDPPFGVVPGGRSAMISYSSGPYAVAYPDNFLLWPDYPGVPSYAFAGSTFVVSPPATTYRTNPVPKPRGKAKLPSDPLLVGNPRVFGMLGLRHYWETP